MWIDEGSRLFTGMSKEEEKCRPVLGGYRRKKKLHNLSDREIIRAIGMENLPAIIDLLYSKYKGICQLIDIGGDCMFRFGDTNVANVSYLATYVHFLSIENGILKLEGNVSWPAVLKDRFKFSVWVNGRESGCREFDAGLDLAYDGKVYETRRAFLYEQQLDERECYDISFCYECNGIPCRSGKINAMRFSPVADVLERQYAVREGWILFVEGSHIKLKKAAPGEAAEFERLFLEAAAAKTDAEDVREAIEIRKEYFRRKREQKKAVWLFMDRIDKADDNGEAFFEYVCRKKPEHADCYFVISRDSPDYDRLAGTGKVVEALSKEHRILLLLADYIFTSQLNGWGENPYGNLEEYFRDLYHRARVVFLQHGVTKDNQANWLNRYNQNLHAVICSAREEQKAFLEYPYWYEESRIWNTGMPRMDRLYNADSKVILFMPTWRKALMEQRLDEDRGIYRWYLKEGFRRSSYRRFYTKILSDRYFLGKCTEAGYRVIFMPHPIMQPFIGEFQAADEVEILPYDTSWRELFARGSILVTDYSSVAFDFAYLKKPVIYCQFDRKEFFQSHTYQEGYFDYGKMGFGEIAQTRRKLYQLIFEYLEQGCREKDIYQERVKAFYTYLDTKCCERIYERVMKEYDGVPF